MVGTKGQPDDYLTIDLDSNYDIMGEQLNP